MTETELPVTVARFGEKLNHIERSVDGILVEIRELTRAVVGPGGHGERIQKLELDASQIREDVHALREAERSRVKQASLFRAKVGAGVVTAILTSAVAGWLAGHT